MISAIVFDFDGVIADSEILHLQSYQHVLGPRGGDLTRAEYLERYLGFDDRTMFRTLAEDRGWTLSEDEFDRLVAEKTRVFQALEAEADVLYPGATTCIESLAEVFPLGIASGALRHEIEAVLQRTHLGQHFRFIVASGDTPASKPAPDPYARAAALHGVRPEACLAIEDSRWGIASAKSAGLRCIGITNTYPREELDTADLVIDSLTELTPALVRQFD